MIPLALLALAPYAAADAGLAWSFDGTVRKGAGRYDLAGKVLHGDVAWFVAPKGGFSAQALYESDIAKTKDALAAKGFAQTRKDVLLAGRPPSSASSATFGTASPSPPGACTAPPEAAPGWSVSGGLPRQAGRSRRMRF